MAEKTTKKNTKGNKKVAEKKTTKKVAPKKTTPKKVASKKEVIKNDEVKEVKVATTKVKKEGKFKETFDKVVDKVMSNKPFSISLCIIIILTGALIFTICDKRIPKTKDGKQVLASIKGKNFTADDLYIELKDKNGTETLINMIDNYITSKEVKFTKDDEEYIQDFVDSYKSQAEQYGMSLIDLLANYGLKVNSEDEFYEFIKNSYGASLAVENFVGDQASKKDLEEYYKNNYSDKITVRHILISDSDDNLEKAKEIISELEDVDKEDLEDKFAELAKDNSDDPGSANDGGLITDITKSSVVTEFYDAAYALKNGEYTKEPVKSDYGYHIIYRISSTPVEKFDKIKEQVKSDYAKKILNSDSSAYTTKWAELRESYKLKIFDTNVNEYYKNNLAKPKTED